MAKVFLLMGKIASGKTFLADKIVEKESAILLSSDELMLTIFDNCLGEKHDETQNKIHNYLYATSEKLLRNNINVILDFGFWTKKSRDNAKTFFEKIDCEVVRIYTDYTFEERLELLNKRNEKLKNSTKREFIVSKEMCERFDKKFDLLSEGDYEIKMTKEEVSKF